MTALTFRNVQMSAADPVETWPTEALITALERGTLRDWSRVAVAVRADPWGALARRLEEALAVIDPYGVGVGMRDLLRAARAECDAADRAQVARELRDLVALSKLGTAAFASALGTSRSRLSTYLAGKVTPSAALLVRARRVAARAAERPPGF